MEREPLPVGGRDRWTLLADAELLAQCAVDTYRASGPGGQKRNKTSSAVRVRHLPSGLLVIAEESRSQHENRARGLRRLRQALYLQLREIVPSAQLQPDGSAERVEVRAARGADGRVHLRGRSDPKFWPALGVILDVLAAVEARVSDAAAALGMSTGNLIEVLQLDVKVWEQANQWRARYGQKPLR